MKHMVLGFSGMILIALLGAYEFKKGYDMGDSRARTDYAEHVNECYDGFDRAGIYPDDAKAGELYTCIVDWK